MLIITNLTGAPKDVPNQQVHTGLAIHDQPVPGFFRNLRIGVDGLLFLRGDSQVLIPLSELWKLAETADPSLSPHNSTLKTNT